MKTEPLSARAPAAENHRMPHSHRHGDASPPLDGRGGHDHEHEHVMDDGMWFKHAHWHQHEPVGTKGD